MGDCMEPVCASPFIRRETREHIYEQQKVNVIHNCIPATFSGNLGRTQSHIENVHGFRLSSRSVKVSVLQVQIS